MLRKPRSVALVVIAVLVGAASLVSFAESYRGLYEWALHHGLSGRWAVIWPLQLDTFIGVGELALFVALADAWSRRSRTGAWVVTLLGLAASVAGNVGHVAGHSLADRVTAAVPPLAAAAALAVGLGVLKRVVAARPGTASDATAERATTTTAPRQSRAARTAPPKRQARPAGPDMEAEALALLARQPDVSGADLGRQIGASPRTGQRLLARLAPASGHAPEGASSE